MFNIGVRPGPGGRVSVLRSVVRRQRQSDDSGRARRLGGKTGTGLASTLTSVIWVISGRYRGCGVTPVRPGFGSPDGSARVPQSLPDRFPPLGQGRSAEVD